MRYKIERNDKPKKVDRVEIMIGDCKYRITETVDGKLEIHKSTTGFIEEMVIYPRVTNVINVK